MKRSAFRLAPLPSPTGTRRWRGPPGGKPLRERVLRERKRARRVRGSSLTSKGPLTRLAAEAARHPLPQGERVSEQAAGARPVVGLVTDRMDWHARELRRAFAAAGAGMVAFDLATCAIDTQCAASLRLPRFRRSTAGAVFRTPPCRRDRSSGDRSASAFLHGLHECGDRCGTPCFERCVIPRLRSTAGVDDAARLGRLE